MGNETKNYKFPKPSEDDFYDISEYNQAMDILDETLTGMNDRKLDSNGNASDAVTEFNQEILRENIESGEKLSVSHGKIQKWFSEMKNIAFSGRASDATQDAAHRFVTDIEKDSWNTKVSASGGDISDTKIGSLETVTSEFPVPAEGETPKVFLGKVKKFIRDFNDFKVGIITVGKLVNNGQTTAAGYALDARYGKTLYDLCTQLNSNLTNKANVVDLNATNNKVTILSTGVAPQQYDLLSWAKDEAARRMIWRITGSTMIGTPDDTLEWCCLNYQDPVKARGCIIALQYGGTAVLRRDYFCGAWLQNSWIPIRD